MNAFVKKLVAAPRVPAVGEREGSCPIRAALKQVTCKWACWTILVLADRPYRFNELRREIGEVSQRMLATTLVDLQRNGFIERRVLSTKPPSVEYSLTELGRSLLPWIDTVLKWWIEKQEDIKEARRIYDASH